MIIFFIKSDNNKNNIQKKVELIYFSNTKKNHEFLYIIQETNIFSLPFLLEFIFF